MLSKTFPSRFTAHAKSVTPAEKKKPTRSGLYWYRGDAQGWDIVKVYYLGTSLHVADLSEGSNSIRTLKRWPAGQWRLCRPPVC